MSAYDYGHVEPGLSSPRRGVGPGQPHLLLQTSLNNARNIQHGFGVPNNQVPPMSAASLSSPFALNSASPASASPGSAIRGSPISYNPQEWAQRNRGDRWASGGYTRGGQVSGGQIVYAPRLQGPDEPIQSPPPPYSTEPVDDSPAASTPSNQFSPQYLPSSASTCMSPVCVTAQDSGGLQHEHNPEQHSLTTPTPQQGITLSQPPASRRAASTGDIFRNPATRSPLSLHNPAIEEARHGHALPPPPPCPPPRGGRSMSLNRAGESSYVVSNVQQAPRTRRPPALGIELGPIPPTPADWVDTPSDGAQQSTSGPEYFKQPEALEVRNAVSTSTTRRQDADIDPGSNSNASTSHVRRESYGGLVRSAAVRNRSSSALRDRRSASRAGRKWDIDDGDVHQDDALAQPLQNLVLSSKGSSLAERRRSARLTPKSANSFQGIDAALDSSRTRYSQSTPVWEKMPASGSPSIGEQVIEQEPLVDASTPTQGVPAGSRIAEMQPALLVSPQMPLSPTAQQLFSSSAGSTFSNRPISHLLHMPNDDAKVKVKPMSPESTHSLMDFDEPSDHDLPSPRSPNLFMAEAIERHRLFIEEEAAAQDDSEKLHLFVQYATQESRIRRARYSKIFIEENLQPAELLCDMFSMPQVPAEPTLPIQPRTVSQSSSFGTGRRSSASSGTSFAESPQPHSRSSTAATSDPDRPLKLDMVIVDTMRRREGAFVPALSPIASMSAVTGRDELESRGRAPSRWWEEGSNSSGNGFNVFGRSKRESKYMSAMIQNGQISAVPEDEVAGPSSAPPPGYRGSYEYPPEKTGFQVPSSPPSQNQTPLPRRQPYEGGLGVLDVSRFTTLPPPYPRHHPAVNNSHPDLADTRAILRTLNDFGEADTAKADYQQESSQKRARADSWSEHLRSMHEQEMHFRFSQGDITRQDFDAANFALEDKVYSSKKQAIQSCFELYQNLVVTPVHTLLDTRITIATDTIKALTASLLERGSTPLPDQTQTEGDSQPELLEKITLLKWLFEACETLYRAQFDIISKRNDLYRELVLFTYSAPSAEQNAATQTKAAEAKSFFDKDLIQREKAATSESLARWTSFHDTVRAAVTTGVQAQLSAFWDIAPQLQELLQHIPSETSSTGSSKSAAKRYSSLADLEIVVPKQELDENPSYWEHPLRYLYSVIGHAEASTRQFVEAQVSLWCLEQEIREGLVRAQGKVDEADEEEVEEEIKRGVRELQEKVSVVEGQWAEGLGAEFERVKLGVKTYLEERGGWDEEIAEIA